MSCNRVTTSIEHTPGANKTIPVEIYTFKKRMFVHEAKQLVDIYTSQSYARQGIYCLCADNESLEWAIRESGHGLYVERLIDYDRSEDIKGTFVEYADVPMTYVRTTLFVHMDEKTETFFKLKYSNTTVIDKVNSM